MGREGGGGERGSPGEGRGRGRWHQRWLSRLWLLAVLRDGVGMSDDVPTPKTPADARLCALVGPPRGACGGGEVACRGSATSAAATAAASHGGGGGGSSSAAVGRTCPTRATANELLPHVRPLLGATAPCATPPPPAPLRSSPPPVRMGVRARPPPTAGVGVACTPCPTPRAAALAAAGGGGGWGGTKSNLHLPPPPLPPALRTHCLLPCWCFLVFFAVRILAPLFRPLARGSPRRLGGRWPPDLLLRPLPLCQSQPGGRAEGGGGGGGGGIPSRRGPLEGGGGASPRQRGLATATAAMR